MQHSDGFLPFQYRMKVYLFVNPLSLQNSVLALDKDRLAREPSPEGCQNPLPQ